MIKKNRTWPKWLDDGGWGARVRWNEVVSDKDDDEHDIELEAAKVLTVGKSLGFLVKDDADVNKALIRIEKKEEPALKRDIQGREGNGVVIEPRSGY